VGASLACDLGQAVAGGLPLSVGLVEGRRPADLSQVRSRTHPDPRVYSMTPASVDYLTALGVWDAVYSRAQPFQAMQVCWLLYRCQGTTLDVEAYVIFCLGVGSGWYGFHPF
jgi:2-polyprenyl-6-methoxyphenol hydroxylase-like FAD-dependent oxidoreductase